MGVGANTCLGISGRLLHNTYTIYCLGLYVADICVVLGKSYIFIYICMSWCMLDTNKVVCVLGIVIP